MKRVFLTLYVFILTMYDSLKEQDPTSYRIAINELEKQRKTINLIASENIVSKAVLEAMASVLTNKYAEGYPGKRYYGGNKYIDEAELLAIERAKKLFEVEHANVQSHSGSSANFSAYMALLNPGDKIMGLALDNGGHLTHGHKINFSSKFFQSSFYYLDKETELLDYDEIRKRVKEEKPKLIIAGYSAYSREINFDEFREIADEVNAYLLADISHIAGLIAAKVHRDAKKADVITTTTHKTLRGPRGAIIMCKEEHAKAIDRAVFPGSQGGPLEHVILAKAVAFGEALKDDFKEYARQIVKNSKAMAEEMQSLGYRIVSGGTDNHLFLVDLSNKGINGKEAQEKLEKAGIILNMNGIPFDKNPPFKPSGIRIGTPAITTRGFKESEAKYVAKLIDDVLEGKRKEEEVRKDVEELCSSFPIYTDIKL